MPAEDEPDDIPGFRPPLPPDDRLWRHPSELGPAGAAHPLTLVTTTRTPTRTWVVAVLSALVGAGATVAVLAGVGVFRDDRPQTAVEQIQRDLPKQPGASELAIANQVLPAVARVDASGPGGAVGGSAVLFRTDGYLLTTADAVDGADTITVVFDDGQSSPAHLVGSDRSSDLAVLKVERDQTPTAVLGQPTDLQLGEPAIAVASTPGRPGAPTISVGLVSALDQRVDQPDGSALHDMIQTNVRLGSEGSGAVLIDSSGSVVGLVTGRGARVALSGTKAQADTGVPTRFATPIDYAKSVADEIVLTGHVAHSWLGVEGSDLVGQDLETLGRGGALVTRVSDASPAAAGGIRPGDIIVSVDSQPIGSMSALVVALRRHHPGDLVGLAYVRDGEEQVALVTLSEKSSVP